MKIRSYSFRNAISIFIIVGGPETIHPASKSNVDKVLFFSERNLGMSSHTFHSFDMHEFYCILKLFRIYYLYINIYRLFELKIIPAILAQIAGVIYIFESPK